MNERLRLRPGAFFVVAQAATCLLGIINKEILIMLLKLVAFAFAASAAFPLAAETAMRNIGVTTASETLEHGGGCRKSSPPGRCCHMEKRVGRVHCH